MSGPRRRPICPAAADFEKSRVLYRASPEAAHWRGSLIRWQFVRDTAGMRLGWAHDLSSFSLFLAAVVSVGCGDDGSGESGSASESASAGTDTDPTASGTSNTATVTAGTDSTTVSSDSDSTGGTDQPTTTSQSGTDATTDATVNPSSTGDTDAATDGSTSDATDSGSTGSGSTGTTGMGTDDSTGSSGSTGGNQVCTCAENTDLIYVLSDDAELWSFDPMTLAFAQITPSLGCPQTDTFSMSVDRNGIAHVMFQNDDIYTIDVNDPNMCVDPGYTPGQMNFDKFGMGFVSNSQFDPCDQLYAHSWSGVGGFSEGPDAGRLGVLDPETLTTQEIGFIDYDGGELTGTGDGRLFAFAGDPAELIEYDKTDASVVEVTQLNMSLTNAFAFGFHGGDFYFFTESNGNPLISQVTHFDYDDTQDLEVVVAQAPIRIVGAGVSTCAPIIR